MTISAILNIEDSYFNTYGEIIAFVIAIIFLVILIIGSLLNGFILYWIKKKYNLHYLSQLFGSIINDIKTDTLMQLSYYTFFLSYRLAFIFIVLYTRNQIV